MKFLDKIINFFRRKNKSNIKINKPEKVLCLDSGEDFRESLRIMTIKRRAVRVIPNIGDGIGIDRKISN